MDGWKGEGYSIYNDNEMTYNPGEALFWICLLVTLGDRGMPEVIAVWVDDVASIKFFRAKDGEFKICLKDNIFFLD